MKERWAVVIDRSSALLRPIRVVFSVGVFVVIKEAVFIETIEDESFTHTLDDHVESRVLVIHVQARVSNAGCIDTHLPHQLKRQALMQHRRILNIVSQDDGLKPQKLTGRIVAIKTE